MKLAIYILPMILLCACSGPQVTSQRVEEIDGNRLQYTSGTTGEGRFVTVENLDKRWEGKFKGGQEKWQARADLLEKEYRKEIESICGEWFYQAPRPATYKMLDKDETMGGLAPVLGVTAAIVAYAAAYSATDDANIPVSVYADFICRKDGE